MSVFFSRSIDWYKFWGDSPWRVAGEDINHRIGFSNYNEDPVNNPDVIDAEHSDNSIIVRIKEGVEMEPEPTASE